MQAATTSYVRTHALRPQKYKNSATWQKLQFYITPSQLNRNRNSHWRNAGLEVDTNTTPEAV